jgi:hypothetical protein
VCRAWRPSWWCSGRRKSRTSSEEFWDVLADTTATT